jgi:hypothetical protein
LGNDALRKQGKEGRSVEATFFVFVVSFVFPHSFFVELTARDRTEIVNAVVSLC